MARSHRERRLPDVVVIGAAKCATHWLNECLREHPDVFVTRDVHEIFYFDRYYERGLDWYAHYFRGASNGQRVVEVTPTYLGSATAAARVKETLPEASVVVQLRDPVARAWSKYLHLWRKGDLPKRCTFREARLRVTEIVGDSEYARCLESWYEQFGVERVHHLFLDDAAADPTTYLSDFYGWLGVRRDFRGNQAYEHTNEHASPRSRMLATAAHRSARFLHANGLHSVVEVMKSAGVKSVVHKQGADARHDPPPMTLDERDELRELFADDVAKLSSTVGRDLAGLWWSESSADGVGELRLDTAIETVA
jgi:hypothetical protein